LWNTKKLRRAIQIKRSGMLTFGVLFLHDNAPPHTAARTRALLEHFNWELFDHPPYSPDLAPSDYHLFTYLKNWLRHSPSTIMRSWWKVSKRGWAHRRQTSLTKACKNLFPDPKRALIPAMTTLRSSLSAYVFFYIIIFFSRFLFC
jgi:transposase